MTIIVIGRTVRSRSRTAYELRRAGHEVVAAPAIRTEVSRTAPLDPGHAGEPLRRLLIRVSSLLRHAWLGSRKHAARRQRGSAKIDPGPGLGRVVYLGSRNRSRSNAPSDSAERSADRTGR
jgi:hypothetical protein